MEQYDWRNNPLDVHLGDTKLELLSSATGLCGCGSGKDFKTIYETLINLDKIATKQFDGVRYELALKILSLTGITEHGGSVFGSWLSEDGKYLMTLLEKLPDGW